MKLTYRAIPVLQGGREYYVSTAQGAQDKAISEAENWIVHNCLEGEVWIIKIEKIRDRVNHSGDL
jgi:hypothetical protein